MTPRFLAAVNRLYVYLYAYLSIVPYIELSIYRGWQESIFKRP